MLTRARCCWGGTVLLGLGACATPPMPGADAGNDTVDIQMVSLIDVSTDASTLDMPDLVSPSDVAEVVSPSDVAEVVSPPDAGPCAVCTTWSRGASPGDIAESALTELSGLAASWQHDGLWYAHNDSGDTPRFFALSSRGERYGEWSVEGAQARDWEDLAVGPCDTGSCVFLGDIGDNNLVRTEVCVYEVREAQLQPALQASTAAVASTRYCFQYPDGPHNAEALLVHPTTGELWIIGKDETGAPPVFRARRPWSSSQITRLEPVGNLALPATGSLLVTAGDFHPCGDKMLVRTYSHLWEYTRASGATLESLPLGTAVSVPIAFEAQGEAVGYTRDGHGYFAASEGAARPLPLHAGGCL